MSLFRCPLTVAITGALVALAWQTATVQANYNGQWSGLFCIGKSARLPPVASPGAWRHAGPGGYDGQHYRVLAYDPFLRLDTAAYLDSADVRARRILIPLLAWLLAFGQPAFVDAAYILVIAGCIFLGVYMLAACMLLLGRPAAWGLWFLLIPTTVVSIDRMTIDIGVATLAACCARQWAAGEVRWLWPVLAAAPLVRETGVILIAAAVLAALVQRRWLQVVAWSSAGLPTVAWFIYIHLRTRPGEGLEALKPPNWATPQLGRGVVGRFLEPPEYGLPALPELVARNIDRVALTGMILAALLAIWLLREKWNLPSRLALALFVLLLIVMHSTGFWVTPFGYSRPFGPLFVFLLAAAALRPGSRALLLAALPALMVDLRLGTEIWAQIRGVAAWVF